MEHPYDLCEERIRLTMKVTRLSRESAEKVLRISDWIDFQGLRKKFERAKLERPENEALWNSMVKAVETMELEHARFPGLVEKIE